MTTQTSSPTANNTLLRRALQGNVIFSGISGLVAIVAAGPLAAFVGLPSPIILMVLGLGLIGYAALLYRIAARQPIPRAEAAFPIIADSLWVVGSVVLLLGGWVPFTPAGVWTVAILADVVAVFAVVQFVGWRRL